MEKISLYDFLSVLLPGAILSLVIAEIAHNNNVTIINIDNNTYFQLTIFLSSSIFLGSLINIISRNSLKIFKKIALYNSILKIYESSKALYNVTPYFENKLQSNTFKNDTTKNDKIEHLWATMYYELEANDKIRSSKTFQSFYFFFRNFFMLGIFLFIILLITIFICLFNDVSTKNYVLMFIINFLAMMLSIWAGHWNRKKMVERLFWTYYSLNKNK